MKVLIVVALALVAIAAFAEAKTSSDELLLAEWNEFKATHGKTYESPEQEDRRFQIYLAARKSIAEHNQGYVNGVHTYRKAVNKFADIDREEFLASYTGLKTRPTETRSISRFTFVSKANVTDLPNSIDWRKNNAVTHVKNQGQCGSCWAFSTTGSVEGAHAIKTGKLVSLSEKQLVDCSRANEGCNGGWIERAFEYIIKNGIESEKSYPYVAREGKCRFRPSKVAVKVKSYVDIPRNDERKLMEAVAKIGPVSIAIDATDSLQHYSGGIFSDPACNPTYLNHAVLVVGYGTHKKHGDYWIVKNSWAKSWGESGYIRLARNKGNMCGVASDASYPVV